MTRRIGRPMKYAELLLKLENEDLYTPATIASFAVASGWVAASGQKETRLARSRIRIALGRYSNNHFFPDEGDGMITLAGQAPTPGWFGWRWKATVQEELESQDGEDA